MTATGDGRSHAEQTEPSRGKIVRVGSLVHNATGDAAEQWLLRTLLGASPVGMCIIDRDLRYHLINDALAAMNRHAAEDHINRSVGELIPSVERQARETMDLIVSTRAPLLDREFVGYTPDAPGALRHFRESWFPLFDNTGEVWAAGVSIEETTERHDLEQKLREANAQKDRFIAFLSHELRNYLGPASNAVFVMSRTEDPALRTSMHTLARTNLDHMARLLNDLLDASKIARGVLQYSFDAVELCELVAEIARMVASQAIAKGIELHVPAKCSCLVRGDAGRLRQVFSNLLLNAFHHSREGGNVWITVGQTMTMAEVRVRDDGEGIDARHVANIFNPFYTTRPLDHRGGTGVGLSISRDIVEAHGGTIEAHSEGLGHGAEFVVRLPLT